MDELALVELQQFLNVGTRPDIQLLALKSLLSLSADEKFCFLLSSVTSSNSLIDDLCRLFASSHQNASLQSILLAIFINLSGSARQIAFSFLVQSSGPSLIKTCFELATSQAPKNLSVSSAQLLSNLSRHSNAKEKLYELLSNNDSQFLRRIFGKEFRVLTQQLYLLFLRMHSQLSFTKRRGRE